MNPYEANLEALSLEFDTQDGSPEHMLGTVSMQLSRDLLSLRTLGRKIDSHARLLLVIAYAVERLLELGRSREREGEKKHEGSGKS